MRKLIELINQGVPAALTGVIADLRQRTVLGARLIDVVADTVSSEGAGDGADTVTR